jgi:hypothetical protein
VKGVPNKVTREVREAVQKALDAQGDKLSGWFDAVAADDPGRALQLYGQLAEYVSPKLARKEITGEDGEPIRVVTVDRDE